MQQRMHVTVVTTAALSRESNITSSKTLNLFVRVPVAHFANHLAPEIQWL
jgi:hypothetical protein